MNMENIIYSMSENCKFKKKISKILFIAYD